MFNRQADTCAQVFTKVSSKESIAILCLVNLKCKFRFNVAVVVGVFLVSEKDNVIIL